jgi:hypothetical protein
VNLVVRIGLFPAAARTWSRTRQDLVDRGLKPGTSQAESAELVAARQKIRDLEEENKILRKAAAAVQEVAPPKERLRLAAGPSTPPGGPTWPPTPWARPSLAPAVARRESRRPRNPVHLLGLHRPGQERGPAALARHRRRALRQRGRRVVLGADAGRAAQSEAMAHAGRGRQRDLRVDRGLPQPPPSPQPALGWAAPPEFETEHRLQATAPHDQFR